MNLGFLAPYIPNTSAYTKRLTKRYLNKIRKLYSNGDFTTVRFLIDGEQEIELLEVKRIKEQSIRHNIQLSDRAQEEISEWEKRLKGDRKNILRIS